MNTSSAAAACGVPVWAQELFMQHPRTLEILVNAGINWRDFDPKVFRLNDRWTQIRICRRFKEDSPVEMMVPGYIRKRETILLHGFHATDESGLIGIAKSAWILRAGPASEGWGAVVSVIGYTGYFGYLTNELNVTEHKRLLQKYVPMHSKHQQPIVMELTVVGDKAEIKKSSQFNATVHSNPNVIVHFNDHMSSWTINEALAQVTSFWLDLSFKR
jgi:hypothetical protein